MLDTLTTLFRARAARIEDDLIDRNALAILDGQIRDAARALDAMRRALAIAAAQSAEGRDRLQKLVARIADLEDRAVAALRDGADGLAERAAETIADLEAERASLVETCGTNARDYESLAMSAKSADKRLADLERGRRTAEAAEAVRRLRFQAPGPLAGPNALARAETTLARLRRAQERSAAADRLYDELVPGRPAATICDELEAAGYGAPTRPTAASIIARLRSRSRDAE